MKWDMQGFGTRMTSVHSEKGDKMTLKGAIKQLHELQSAEDMPVYYKPIIAEVINVLLMDTQEVRYGHWIDHTYKYRYPVGRYECSMCGGAHDMEWDYCPSCGAKMDEEVDENETS